MSSSAALLDQDFGSESEDDNFNPAPAEDSENDAAGESDADLNAKTSHKNEQNRQTGGESRAADEVVTEKNGSSLANGKVEQADEEEEDDEEDGENGNHILDLLNYGNG